MSQPTHDTSPRTTTARRFLGMNIKGTPAMRATDVGHDLAVAEDKASVLVLQEFKWPWYWRTLSRRLPLLSPHRWRTSPGAATTALRPLLGAQAVVWRGRGWRRRGTKCVLLHHGIAGISETRYVRAVLLQDRATGLRAWFGTTHFVVGGDVATDSPRRRALLDRDIAVLDDFLAALAGTGHPVVFQLDANIKPSSDAYPAFHDMLRKHGASVHGTRGVEYLFTINSAATRVDVKRDWVVPTSELRTDHEGRGITFRLVQVTA